MSFLDTLSKLLSKSDSLSEGDVKTLQADRRYNERIELVPTDLCQIHLQANPLPIGDISYGGVAIYTPPAAIGEITKGVISGDLCVAGAQIACGFEKAHSGTDSQGRQVTGITFHHHSRDSLVFLRDVIEPLRQGHTLQQVSPEHLQKQRVAKGISYFRGEGPCDLEIKDDANYKLTFLLTNGQYGELCMKDDHLKTSITKESAHRGVQQIAETGSFDLGIFRQGIMILAAGAVKAPQLLMPALRKTEAMYKALDLKRSA